MEKSAGQKDSEERGRIPSLPDAGKCSLGEKKIHKERIRPSHSRPTRRGKILDSPLQRGEKQNMPEPATKPKRKMGPAKITHPKRTAWLRKAAKPLLSHMQTVGYGPLPRVWIYCWPYVKDCDDGEYWTPSPMAAAQIAVYSELHNPFTVLATLLHELCHHATQTENHSHGPQFRSCARAAGLRSSKYWGTPIPEMREEFERIIRKLGPYPLETRK